MTGKNMAAEFVSALNLERIMAYTAAENRNSNEF